MVINEKNKKSSCIDTMKKLNKHPRLLKQVASHLKKMVTSKIKSLRKSKSKNEEHEKRKDKMNKEKEIKTEASATELNEKLNSAFQEQIKESHLSGKSHERIINETKHISLEVRK